jgi:hypothetical protein
VISLAQKECLMEQYIFYRTSPDLFQIQEAAEQLDHPRIIIIQGLGWMLKGSYNTGPPMCIQIGICNGLSRETNAVCLMPVGVLEAAIYTIGWLADVCPDLSLTHRKIGGMKISLVVASEALPYVRMTPS